MVSQQATQNSNTPHPRPNDWQRDSVRITDAVVAFLKREIVRQQAVVAGESHDLKMRRANGQPCAMAELRASNATAVLQYLGSTLKAFEGNRDFAQVTR